MKNKIIISSLSTVFIMMVAGISIVGSHAVVSGAWGRAFPKYNYRMQVEFFVKVPINASGP